MLVPTSVFLLTLFAGASQAQITRCPCPEELTCTPDGSIYTICQEAAYQGNTYKSFSTVATLLQCVEYCNKDEKCTKAVYNKGDYKCDLKDATGTKWVSSDSHATIRFTSKPKTGTTIKTCPTAEMNVTMPDGAVLASCPNTDYAGKTLQKVENIASVSACATVCGKTAGCARAVYDSSCSKCYLKDKPEVLTWIYKAGFGSVRRISNAPVKSSTSGSVGSGSKAEGQSSNSGSVGSVSKAEGQSSDSGSVEKSSTGTKSPDSKAPAGSDSKALLGLWSQVIKFSIIPVAAYLVYNEPEPERLLLFSSWDGGKFTTGPTGRTQFVDYNFKTGATSPRLVADTKHDMFCPAISQIPGGKIVISGGADSEAVSIYNSATNQFKRAANMKIPRGYQSSATISTGEVFTVGGSWSGGKAVKFGEVYNPDKDTWTLLPGADPTPLLTKDREGKYKSDNHPWLFSWRNGKVFQAGPSRQMNWYSTKDKGSVKGAGVRNDIMDQMCGINVMYETGKILTAGGSQDYTDSPATKMAHVITITEPDVDATVQRVADMHFPRGYANSVVLPNGQVLVTGGQLKSLSFTDIDSVLIPELWDPTTRQWTQLAPAAVPRNYHSVSILLSDARVFVGGGGMCPAAPNSDYSECDRNRAKDHFDGEIFSPPYLFTNSGALATRPVIRSVSKTKVTVGETITVELKNDLEGATFVLIRFGSVTHTINTDQRRAVVKNFKHEGKGKYTVTLPEDSGMMIPGSWLLFALKDGVPSVAKSLSVLVSK